MHTQELLEAAAVHHRRGELQRAAQGYLQVLQRDPEHVEALQLLGMVAHRLGQSAQGLELVERALKLDKRHGVAHANRAILLRALGRPGDAVAAAERALRIRPDLTRTTVLLADLHGELGQGEQAVIALRRGLDRDPEHAELREALGAALLSLGRACLGRGEVDAALVSAGELCRLAPERDSVWLLLVDVLSQHPEPPPDLEPLLVQAWDRGHLDLQRLERPSRAVLEALPEVSAVDAGGGAEALDALAAALDGHPLAHPWLRRSVVASGAWEARLVALRDRLLVRLLAEEPVDLDLLVSLAMQAWITEHAWPEVAPGVRDAVEALGLGTPGVVGRALLGTLEASGEIPDDPVIAELVTQQISEPELARRLGSTLPTLGLSADPVSQAVAAQYEANPYPRLVHVQSRAPQALAVLLGGVLPHVVIDPLPTPLRVLVAGCGTGQHPLSTATRISDAQVTALDLSRASLGRAAREAQRRGVDRIRFVQADILELSELSGGPFHLVESGGVLHHLADPEAGFRSLLSHLAPGGLLRIGLYSERGRADVIAARALAEERGWTDDPAGIRLARQEILALPPGHLARGLLHSFDFYSLSGSRDLFLHRQEHRFTPAQLAELLDRLDLDFLGFQHAQGSVAASYLARFPDDPHMTDLGNWDLLEQDQPHIFSGMLQFWCRRA